MPEYISVPVELAHREFVRVDAEEKPTRRPEGRERGGVPLSEAREIIGEQDCIGPDQLRAIFGVEVRDVPPIPFSPQELREAKERGEFLVLRIDSLPDGKPLTMQNLHAYFEGDFKVLLSATDQWKLDSDFFTKERPEVSWALVSKDFIPNTTSKNYFEQTKSIIEHLRNVVYKNIPLPPQYQEAIAEFEAYIQRIFPGKSSLQIQTEIGGNNWKRYAEQLSALKINQLCRQSGVDALFDIAAYYKHTGNKLLEAPYAWTKSRASVGSLVSVGSADAGGAGVGRWVPGRSGGDLGVLLSRR